MAAPWRPWASGLLSVLRSRPVFRPLQNGVPRDVLLFHHERGRFFAILGLFCAGQGIFWTSLAVAALSRPPTRVPAEAPKQGYTNLRSALWRYSLAVGCCAMVMLLAGGQQVMFTTYAPFGSGTRFTVPLNQVSCMAHRGEVPAMLPLKIKGRHFYFLLDKSGHFPNTQLFDNTVGAYRSL